MVNSSPKKKIIFYALLVLSFAGLGYVYFVYKGLYQEIIFMFDQSPEIVSSLSESNIRILSLLYDEKSRNTEFENQIKEIASTVGVLDKLSKTDKELLQKYSKVYFLNEHYVPDSLTSIDKGLLYEPTRDLKLHSKVYRYFELMMQAASSSGVDIKVISAYRSFGDQSQLKNGYTVVYGTGANKFSADQGYSEHQLGTALDFTTKATGADFNKFDKTDAYTWLNQNAYKYGFVLSYPEDNGYYQFEPWHWRFVGVGLATRLHEENEHFYDIEQRNIDLYLVSIFD